MFAPQEARIGILDRLGLKGEDWSEFADWFGNQLFRIMQARALDAGTEQSDALLIELDQRVQRFIARRGEEALVQANPGSWPRPSSQALSPGTAVALSTSGFASSAPGSSQSPIAGSTR